MKNTMKLCSALMLALSLVGCGQKGDLSSTDAKDKEETTVNDVYAEEGYGTGFIEDHFHTYFFDFTVNDGGLYETYGDYTPAEGNVFLELELTVTNTTTAEIAMYDYDFFLSYGKDDDAIAYPITDEGKFEPVYDMFPSEYALKPRESRTGTLVYEIPESSLETDYIDLYYLEQFDTENEEESTGDLFVVYISWPEEEETE